MVGASRLERWEEVAHINTLPVWFFLMLGPFGDVPYYIAGLTSIAIWKIIAIALLLRTPSVLVAAAVGAGLVDWRSPWVIGGALVLMSHGRGGDTLSSPHRDLNRPDGAAAGGEVWCAAHSSQPASRDAAGGGRIRCSNPLTTAQPSERASC
jgi:hypothetical protein